MVMLLKDNTPRSIRGGLMALPPSAGNPDLSG
jgi:hypothetical protein